jgi:hypothetical protein
VRVTWIAGAGFAILLGADCGGVDTRTLWGTGPDAGAASDDGGFQVGIGLPVLVIDGRAPPRPLPPFPPDAGPPPFVACGAGAVDGGSIDGEVRDAGADDGAGEDAAPEAGVVQGAIDAGVLCPLPPTSCIGTMWQVYYSGGTCQNGVCAFASHVVPCSDCGNGRCGLVPYSE